MRSNLLLTALCILLLTFTATAQNHSLLPTAPHPAIAVMQGSAKTNALSERLKSSAHYDLYSSNGYWMPRDFQHPLLHWQ